MITAEETRKVTLNGVWKQNPGVVQILGMCPTLAMTSTVVNGVSLGLATALVMLLSGVAVASLRQYVPNELRNPVYILIIAALALVLVIGASIASARADDPWDDLDGAGGGNGPF